MSEHIKATKPIFLTAVIGVFLLCVVLAVIAFRKDATGDTQFTFFGQSFKSTHVGIAAVFIAGVVVVLTIRRVFKSLDHAVSTESAGGGHDPEHTRLLAEHVKAQRRHTSISDRKTCARASRASSGVTVRKRRRKWFATFKILEAESK